MVMYHSSHMRLQFLLAARLFPYGVGSKLTPPPHLVPQEGGAAHRERVHLVGGVGGGGGDWLHREGQDAPPEAADLCAVYTAGMGRRIDGHMTRGDMLRWRWQGVACGCTVKGVRSMSEFGYRYQGCMTPLAIAGTREGSRQHVPPGWEPIT